MKNPKELFQDIGLLSLGCYVAGFIAWNFYLSHFGFFEFDLLQTRFLSAGILILIIPLIILNFSKRFKIYFSNKDFFWQSIIFFTWVVLFTLLFFPYIPQYLGGAKPYLASVVINQEMSESFKLMGVSYPADKSTESLRACKLYENSESVLIGFVSTPETQNDILMVSPNRVLIIYKNHIFGMSILPQNQMDFSVPSYNVVCKPIRIIYGISPDMGEVLNKLNNIFK